MFDLAVVPPDSSALRARLRAVREFRPDLSGVEAEARRLVSEANRDARLRGLDADGDPLAPISEAGRRRRGRRGDGDGPPLAPNFEASRVVANFVVTTEAAPGRLVVSAGWVGMPWLAAHRDGSGRLPRRDVMSRVPPAAREGLDRLVSAEAARQLREATAGRAGAASPFGA